MAYGFEDDKSKYDLDNVTIHDTGWISTSSGNGKYRRYGNIVNYRYAYPYSYSTGYQDKVIDTLPVEVLSDKTMGIVGSKKSSYAGSALFPFNVEVRPTGEVVAQQSASGDTDLLINAVWFVG